MCSDDMSLDIIIYENLLQCNKILCLRVEK
jgi:hypothetical protein